MHPRRLALRLLPPIALVILLAALAGLQYRWLGRVSEAERSQMHELLERRVQAFSADFDRELAHAFLVFQSGLVEIDPADAAPLAERHDEWRTTARFPQLIRTVYAVAVRDDQRTLWRYLPGGRALEPADWPASLAPLRDQEMPSLPSFDRAFGATVPAPRTVVLSSASLVLPAAPALIVPVAGRSSDFTPVEAARGIANIAMGLRADASRLILELDRTYISETVLPALAVRHAFDSHGYDLAIRDAGGDTLFQRGGASRPIDPAAADAQAPLFLLRFENLRERTLSSSEPAGATAAPDRSAVAALPMVMQRQAAMTLATVRPEGTGVLSGEPWHVLVRHSAGSLDAAVAQARQRNLWLSFGILAVLAASVALIVANARRSERLAAQQMDFVATVSHELRTPLAVIRSAAQNLSAGVIHEPDRASRYGELIEHEGRRLTEMVEHVLEYAGMGGNRRSARTAPVDCGSVVRDVLSAHQTVIDAERFSVTLDIAVDAPAAMADEDAVRRAVQNLVGNALKHGADGRWLGVSVQGGDTRGRREVRIAVSDRGRGIAAEDLPHIFDPFYRGRYAIERQIHGNGLGLSLVQRIAGAHGGRIGVRSSGERTTFTLHLPAAPADASFAPLAEPLAGGAAPGRRLAG